MKIQPGYYKCRNGRKARALCIDAPGDYPVVGYVEIGSNQRPECWRADGRYVSDSYNEPSDLIEPWVDEPEPEKPIEVTLSQLYVAMRYAATAKTTGDIGDCLERAGISVPQPPAKQPVHVSGYVNVYASGIKRFHEDKGDAYSCAGPDRIACVYVTGTEGIGPEGEEG